MHLWLPTWMCRMRSYGEAWQLIWGAVQIQQPRETHGEDDDGENFTAAARVQAGHHAAVEGC